MLIQLSDSLSEHTPFYFFLPKPLLRRTYNLQIGDRCNSFYLTTSKHCGTHADAPRHFVEGGKRIGDYTTSELVFSRVSVLDVPLADRQLLEPEHLQAAVAAVDRDADLVPMRSGFGRIRADAERYVNCSPGLGPGAATFLMERFSNLRALAVDFMSTSALAHEAAGADAHRVFLGCTAYAARPTLLLEDAPLPDAPPPLRRVFIVPWMFEGLDSAPCTMLDEAANA